MAFAAHFLSGPLLNNFKVVLTVTEGLNDSWQKRRDGG